MDVNEVIIAGSLAGGIIFSFLCFKAYSASNEAERRLEEIDSKLGRLRALVAEIESVKRDVREATARKVDDVTLERIFADAVDYFAAALSRDRG